LKAAPRILPVLICPAGFHFLDFQILDGVKFSRQESLQVFFPQCQKIQQKRLHAELDYVRKSHTPFPVISFNLIVIEYFIASCFF